MHSSTSIFKSIFKLFRHDIRQYRYLGWVGLAFILNAALWITWISAQSGHRTTLSHYYESLEHFKLKLLNQTQDKPRIVILSGSSTDYGVRASEIEAETQIPTYNLGLIASLKLSYLTYLAKQNLKAGDILLFPLEYHYYLWESDNNSDAIEYIFSSRPDFIESLQPFDQLKLLFSISIVNPVKGWQYSLNQHSSQEYSDSFQPSARNKNGDFLLNAQQHFTAEKQTYVQNLKPLLFSTYYPAGFSKKSIVRSVMPEFIQWCTENQIQFIPLYPPYLYFDEYQIESESQFYASIADFYQNLKVPPLGQAYDFMYDRSAFFDNRYHLKASSASRHTATILKHLKPRLNLPH